MPGPLDYSPEGAMDVRNDQRGPGLIPGPLDYSPEGAMDGEPCKYCGSLMDRVAWIRQRRKKRNGKTVFEYVPGLDWCPQCGATRTVQAYPECWTTPVIGGRPSTAGAGND